LENLSALRNLTDAQTNYRFRWLAVYPLTLKEDLSIPGWN
jgi:hypothetical protein